MSLTCEAVRLKASLREALSLLCAGAEALRWKVTRLESLLWEVALLPFRSEAPAFAFIALNEEKGGKDEDSDQPMQDDEDGMIAFGFVSRR